jgi:hypothetical protein
MNLEPDQKMRNRWNHFALPLAEHVSWLNLPPGFGWDPILAFARCLEELLRRGRSARVLRIRRFLRFGDVRQRRPRLTELLGADNDSVLSRRDERDVVRPALGALLGPDGGPVAVGPFAGFLEAAIAFLSRHPESTDRRRLLDLAGQARQQLDEIGLLLADDSEELRREFGRCLGCAGLLIDRGGSLYCSDQCQAARQRRRGRSRARQ